MCSVSIAFQSRRSSAYHDPVGPVGVHSVHSRLHVVSDQQHHHHHHTRSDAFYVAAAERPNNKNVKATIEKGLTDVRVFSSRMPDCVAMLLARTCLHACVTSHLFMCLSES